MHFILYLNTKNKINYIDETMNEKKVNKKTLI